MSSPTRLSWVVLRKHVPVFDAEEKEQEDKIMAEASNDWGNIEDGSWILDQFSLDAHLVEPPELSTLSVRAKIETQERGIGCVLDSVVENYLVMTLVFCDRWYGLVYDAAKNSLSLLPATMDSFAGYDFASRVDSVPFFFLRQHAVLPRDDGSYDLLNLGFRSERRDRVLQGSGIIFRWSSHAAGKKWTKQEARFSPHTQVPRQPAYKVDAAFTFKGKVFWADLMLGDIVCDMPSTRTTTSEDVDHVELDFIHLPQECQGRDFSRSYPKDRRTMGPVGDSIKLISIVTISGDNPRDNTPPADVVLRSWTLLPDLRSWTRDQDMELPLPLLWQSEVYKRERLPQAMPQCPVLKADEDGILYLLLGDYYLDWERRARLCREIECVISIDMRTKSLLSCSHRPIKDGLPAPAPWEEVRPSKDFDPDIPTLLAAKFCANHTGWSDGPLHKEKKNRLIYCRWERRKSSSSRRAFISVALASIVVIIYLQLRGSLSILT
ncbi:hypothetical protein CFC21_080394 [Triticum aestivum]|uniref:DUF1618 domain-containing protein n=2 Tax=Triticum aestivum TaxID=4565 RepID=A0A3B6MZ87_WHEAT|nr:uncharacterized protein LOC123125937 [Triticum aestivum]KAF7075632.1 hypothetical protein CFC21_080394 [Triticum aestivum]